LANGYLSLLAKTLARFPLQASDISLVGCLQGINHPSCREIRRWLLAYMSGLGGGTAPLALRAFGMDWPAEAETMIGLARLHNLRACAADVIRRGVPGDFMETGVWRGGACIYLRAILEALGDHHRKVWAADSFQGVSPPDPAAYPEDFGDTLFTCPQLGVSLQTVKSNFLRYGFLDPRVCFLPGWFRDTLPGAPVTRLALLRLDGDLYESTIIALRSLYFKVSAGGLAAYFGMTPRRYQSGEVDHAGRISKCGDGMVRGLLFEAAKVLLSRSARPSAAGPRRERWMQPQRSIGMLCRWSTCGAG
jgi:hypothetical protein